MVKDKAVNGEKPKPKKRGRKPKPKKEKEKKGPPKKRGRKPKGGKIIKKNKNVVTNKEYIPNVILHLKTSTDKLENNDMTKLEYNPKINTPESFSILTSMKTGNLQYKELDEKSNKDDVENTVEFKSFKVEKLETKEEKKHDDIGKNSMKEIWEKLEKLKKNMRTNNISNKSSACFWDTCQFDNPPIYIPKSIKDDKIEAYGCFCSPECALSYLKRENLDSSTMWHRYSLLNIVYGKMFNYEKNIKPAPDPFYTLDKYYGTFSISEWRKLLKNDRLIMVVDKPLSKLLPEIYEENNEEPNITNNLLDKKVSSKRYKLKSREVMKTKKDALRDSFKVF